MISIIIDDHFMPLYIDDAQWIIDQNIKKKNSTAHTRKTMCYMCLWLVCLFLSLHSISQKKKIQIDSSIMQYYSITF